MKVWILKIKRSVGSAILLFVAFLLLPLFPTAPLQAAPDPAMPEEAKTSDIPAAPVPPVEEPIIPPEEKVLEYLEEAVDARINGEKPFFYINPGFNIGIIQATVSTTAQNDDQTAILNKDRPDLSYNFDIVTTGYRITDWLGVSLLASSRSFTLNRQIVGDQDPLKNLGSTPEESDSPKIDLGGEDIGTRLKGYYNYIMPTVYVGGDDWYGFRIGGGIGYGSGWLEGTIKFQNSLSDQLLTRAVIDPSSTNELVAYNMLSGLVNVQSLNPEELYMLAHYRDPGYLQLLGMYWTTKGYIAPSATRLAQFQTLNPDLNLFEFAALEGLSRNNVRMNFDNLFVYQVYVDFPSFYNINSRLSVEMPAFQNRGYDFSIVAINVAFYYPLGIGL